MGCPEVGQTQQVRFFKFVDEPFQRHADQGSRSSSKIRTSQHTTHERNCRTCVNNLEDAHNQIEISKRQVDLANRGYEISEAAYQIGAETQINLLDVSQKLRLAKLGYMKAVLDWNNAYNALLKATGEY